MEQQLSKDGQLSPADEYEEEEMEVTKQIENNIETPDAADTLSNTQVHPVEMSENLTDSTAGTPSLVMCKTEDFDDGNSEDSDSDSSSSSSSSSSPLPSAQVFEGDDDDEGFSQPAPIKTKDEVLLEELPAVEEVCMSLPDDIELQPVGTISSIMQQLVIIQSLKDTPALTDDSIIFRSDRLAVAKVFEVFGPVSSPLYVLRFNSADQISSKGLTEGMTVYYAPTTKEYTGYILTQQLKLFKGSDASWKNDQEPPDEALDYSDDEKEQQAKRKGKNSKKKNDNKNTDNPVHITHNNLQHEQHHREVGGFTPRHAGAPFRHQNARTNHRQFQHAHVASTHAQLPPRHSNVPPMYLPPPGFYPHHPPPPPNFQFYPPPPYFNPSLSSPIWLPNSMYFSDIPPPPPPPPPPQ